MNKKELFPSRKKKRKTECAVHYRRRSCVFFNAVCVFVHLAGHQWVKNNLGVNIKSGWSVDPFGHGPTVPYLLKMSEVTGGTVVQRIHYAWKEWFARTQNGDFFWRQNWDRTGHTDTLTHNLPFDIYSIRGSCGPHPQVRKSGDSRSYTGCHGGLSREIAFFRFFPIFVLIYKTGCVCVCFQS